MSYERRRISMQPTAYSSYMSYERRRIHVI